MRNSKPAVGQHSDKENSMFEITSVHVHFELGWVKANHHNFFLKWLITVCVYECVCECVWVCVCVSVCVSEWECVCVWVCVWVCVSECVCVWVSEYVCVWACVWVCDVCVCNWEEPHKTVLIKNNQLHFEIAVTCIIIESFSFFFWSHFTLQS